MKNLSIIVFDNTDFFHDIIKSKFQSNYNFEFYDKNFRDILIKKLENKIYFINTSLIFDEYKYIYERGGLNLVKECIQYSKQSNPIFFFSFEGQKNLLHYLKHSWLKYSSNYFIHYPFSLLEIENILNKIREPKYYLLKTTEIFKKELQIQLYDSLRSIKHDYLNRISRIRPELVTFLDKNNINHKTKFNYVFEIDLNFLKNELYLLSNKLRSLFNNNPLNSMEILNKNFDTLVEKIEKLPERLIPLSQYYSDQNKFINNFKPILFYLDEISEIFENLINNLKGERIKNGK